MIEENSQLFALPEGWAWYPLGNLVEKIANGITERQSKEKKGIPVSRIETISNGSIDLNKVGYLTDLTPDIIEKFRLREGDILFSHINSDPHLGKTAIFNTDNFILLHGMNLLLIRPYNELIDSRFLHYLFSYYRNIGYFISIAQHAVNQSSINQTKMRNIMIPLAPIIEQRRIILRIEELFGYLDAGTGTLESAKTQLKRYRQAVLNNAVEGRLTKAWRKAHMEIEPAEKLLIQISKERRCFGEPNKTAKTSAKGKRQRKIKHKESDIPNLIDLPELPKTWAWATLDQLSAYEDNSITDGPFGSNLKTSHYTPNGPRVIRLQNIGRGEFIDEKAHISIDHFKKLKRHAVYPGDIVIAALGNPAPRACLIPRGIGDAIVKADCIRLKVVEEKIFAPYVVYSLNSVPTQKRTEEVIHGIGRPRLNLGEIKDIVVPLPPFEEQKVISEEIDRNLSIADKAKEIIEANIKRSRFLRQSILKLAFEGKLAPQNPDDVAASILLETIRLQRAIKSPKRSRRNNDLHHMRLIQ